MTAFLRVIVLFALSVRACADLEKARAKTSLIRTPGSVRASVDVDSDGDLGRLRMRRMRSDLDEYSTVPPLYARSAAKRVQKSGEGSDVMVEQPADPLRCRSQNKVELCELLGENDDCPLNDGGQGTCILTGSVKRCKKTKATPADTARIDACDGLVDDAVCEYTKTREGKDDKTKEGKCATRSSDGARVCKQEKINPKVAACGEDADPDQSKEAGDCCSYTKKDKGKKNKNGKEKSGICELSERTGELKCKSNKAAKVDTVDACEGIGKGEECIYTPKKGETVTKMCLPYTVRDQCLDGSTNGGAGGEEEQQLGDENDDDDDDDDDDADDDDDDGDLV